MSKRFVYVKGIVVNYYLLKSRENPEYTIIPDTILSSVGAENQLYLMDR